MKNREKQRENSRPQPRRDASGHLPVQDHSQLATGKVYGIMAVVLVMLLAIIGIIYNSASGTVIKDAEAETALIELNVSKAIDSPIGFIPGFSDTKSGMAKITIDGIGVASDIEKEVAYYVQEDGGVVFDMLPDDASVTEQLKYLTEKAPGTTFVADVHGASRFMKLDFLSLFDLSSLVSTYPDQYNGLLAAYTEDGQVVGADGPIKPTRGSEACATQGDLLKLQLAGAELNTQQVAVTNTVQSIDENGNATLKFTVSPGFFSDTDKTVREFITECYVKNAANQTDVEYLQQAIDRYTNHPTYTFTIRVGNNGQKSLEVSAAYGNPDTQAAQAPASFVFELLPTGAPEAKVSGPVRSFFDRPNLYGLVYSYCRVPPLVAKMDGSDKIIVTGIASDKYQEPSAFDAAYACLSKEDRLTGYATLPAETWKLNGKTVKITAATMPLALKHHDIAVAIEQYFEKNGYYPSIETVQAGNLPGTQAADLQDAKGQLINKGDITYSVEPENCSQCISYTLEYKIDASTTLKIVDYARQGSDR